MRARRGPGARQRCQLWWPRRTASPHVKSEGKHERCLARECKHLQGGAGDCKQGNRNSTRGELA
eukprot:5201341-Alexandrium_andersonii.AAC.1